MRTSNELDNELVNGTSGADTIENSGQYATIQAGGGNDSIYNEGDNSYIDGEAGNDTIEADDNDYVTVNGGAGADEINGAYYNSSINGGAGNDIVAVEIAEVSTVEGGDGADEISGVFVGSEVNGGNGNDLITLQEGEENTSQENTVIGGKGNDTIINEVAQNYDDEEEVPGNVYQYAQGDGNDLIIGITVNDTLNITSGSISNVEIDDEDNAVLTIGTGKITLEGAAGKTIWLQTGNGDAEEFTLDGEDTVESDYIELTNGNDTYSNLRDNVTIAALAGKDYVYNDAANVYIDGGAGDDTIKNDTVALEGDDTSVKRGRNVTIDGGAGNDSIISCGAEDVSINGGAGNDYIGGDLRSSNTINGGAGNDTIALTSYGGRIIQYENGDGKDIVTGYSEGDEIIIDDDYTASVSGNDWIITVGRGSITLKDAASQTIVINGEEIKPEPDIKPPAGWKYGTSSKNNTNTSVVTATLATGAEDLDLTEAYGAEVQNVDATKITDGVQITGNDLGNSIKGSKGADTIITGTGDDTVLLGSGSNVADVYVYTGGDDVITNYGEGNDTIQIILDDMDNITMTTLSNDVSINTSAGTITLKKASGKNIVLIDANDDTIDPRGGIETISGTAKVDNITNEKDEVVIDALAGNDKITNSGNNVTVIGGKGNDTITNSGEGNIYQYASGDGKDVIVGFGENDTLTITSGSYSYSVSGSDVVVKVGSGSITLKDIETSSIHINDETINIETLPEGWNYGNTAKTLFKATTASAESEIDLNENYGAGVVSVDGSKITGGVQITGNDSGNSIKGGKGADTIIGGEGNDTVSLGSGKDIYIYQGGDDYIADYKDGDDTIQIVGNSNDQTVISSSVKGNDLILYTPNGNITVKNGNKAEQILVVNADGEQIYPTPDSLPEGWKFDSNKKSLSATLKTAETNIDLNEEYGEGVEIVDANKLASGVEIIANDLSNSIKGTKYDDVISGGEGADTISLGGGADVYIYSGGEDVIQDFVAGTDSIQIDTVDVEFNPETDVTTEGNDLVITTAKGTLTIKKGKDKEIAIMDADGEQLYPISDPFPPTGWKLDSQKTKITASSTAEDLDLSIDNSVAENVKNVDASKVTSGVVITGNDNENSIKGGKGDDVISGGGGNDTVSLGGGKDTYIYAGGDDLIQDYVAGADVIQIDTTNVTFDPSSGVSTIGTNVIIATDSGNITVAKGSGKVITIVDENGEQIYPEPDPLPAGWKYDSTHKQVKASATATIEDLDLTSTYGNGVNVVDAASAKTGVNVIGNDDNNSIRGSKLNDVITGGSGNDTVSLGGGADVYVYTGGDDILQDYAVADTIQIDTNDINIEEFSTSGTDFNIVTDLGTLKVLKGSTKVVTVINADGEQIYPEDSLPAGWKYDTSKTLVTASVTSSADDLDLTQSYGENVKKVDASKIQTGAVIYGNDSDNSIKGGKGDDEISGGSGNDTVSLGGGADVYIYSGGDDLIQDYMAGTDKIKVDTANISFDAVETIGSNVIYTTNNGTLTVKNGKNKNITFVDMDDDTISPVVPTVISPDGWKFTSNTASATVKTADDLDLTEDYGDGITKVDASKTNGGVVIVGNNSGNSIKGGSGADTITGGHGNDTVSLGGGADVYIYTEGDDLIQDYKSGQDVIKFENEILSSSVSGTNVVITTEEGKVTVKGMKGKEIEVIDSDGETYTFTDIIDKDNTDTLPAGWKLDTAKKTLTATVASADTEVDLTKSYGTTVTKVDGSKTKGGVEIIGNDLGNSIKGGSGEDTIYGGEGNDTVSLGGGNDLFVYNGGNDLIQDYKAGQDSIQIDTTDIDVIQKYTSGTNVVIETSEGNITIKSGRGKEISLYDEEGEELFFDDDGSFVSANTIDDIFALNDDNYSQGKIDFGKETDVLNPDEDYIAYCNQEENK